VRAGEVMNMMMMTQYFDMLQQAARPRATAPWAVCVTHVLCIAFVHSSDFALCLPSAVLPFI